MFSGSIVALVTPMHDNEVDVERLRELVELHLAEGTSAIVAAGTTGESCTLTKSEKKVVIETVIDQVKERVPVIAGTGAIATAEAIDLSKLAMEVGASASLILAPSCVRPTQEGLYQHYSHIAKAVPLPIILYNAPVRTACDLLPETVGRLSKFSNIIGIKDAVGKLERLKELLTCSESSFDVYSGDDETAASWLLEGANGVISVTANVVPGLMARLCQAAHDGDRDRCLDLNEQLASLHRALFYEANPIPVKWALHKMGLIENVIRLPLTILSEEYHPQLEKILKGLEVI